MVEYKVITSSVLANYVEPKLNAAAQEGWRVVSSYTHKNYTGQEVEIILERNVDA